MNYKRNVKNVKNVKNEEYKPFNNLNESYHKSLCIFLQLHNDKITEEIVNNITKIYKYHKDFDVYITVIKTESIDLINRLTKNLEWKNNIVRIDLFGNRGMDIGAFLWQFEKVEKNYGCLLKFHTKTMDYWRKNIIDPFLKSSIVKYIELLNMNSEFGWIGAKKLLVSIESLERDITRDMEMSVFNRHSTSEERYFIGGSVFMIRFDIIKEMLNNPYIKEYSRKCYEEMPIGWVKHKIPHSFERFILYYSNMKGLKYLGIY